MLIITCELTILIKKTVKITTYDKTIVEYHMCRFAYQPTILSSPKKTPVITKIKQIISFEE
jgi:hypothetical protein